MDYNEALEFVYSRRKFEKSGGFERITALLSLLGNPQNKMEFVHVAGTNGKGSVSTMLSYALCAEGYRTGLFTSPFVIDFCERIQVNNKYIEKDEFALAAQKVKNACLTIEKDGLCPTFFEAVFAAALVYFELRGVQIAVLEAGIGGKRDSTNIIPPPLAAVLVSVSLDHTDVLGETAEEIALEKSGIIKSGSSVVSFPSGTGGLGFVPQKKTVEEIFRRTCKKNGCELLVPDMNSVYVEKEDIFGTDFSFSGLKLHINFTGEHQTANAATAVTALHALGKKGFFVSDKSIAEGLKSTFIPARMEVIGKNPPVILDGGHNEGCMRALCSMLKKQTGERKLTALLAFMKDKDYETAIKLIAPLCESIVFTNADEKRGESPAVLAERAQELCKDVSFKASAAEAFDEALKKTPQNGLLAVAGSFYLAADIRKILLG